LVDSPEGSGRRRSRLPDVAAAGATEAPRALPTLSAVVPNFNHARYLGSALQALLGQSAPILEIIVVDDGSADDSCALVEGLAAEHPRLRLIRQVQNGGVNAAMNRGLAEARGQYICFPAADDLVSPDFASRSLAVLARHPDASLCFSDLAVMAGAGGTVRRFPLFLSRRPCLLGPADIQRVLRRNYFNFPSHSVVYRRDHLLALGGFREDLQWLADWFVNYVLAIRHGACYVPGILGYFRVTPNSYSVRGPRRAAVQRALVYRVVDLLQSSALADVARPFRECGVVPEFSFRLLAWLAISPRHRRYLTPRLVTRLVLRGTWAGLIRWLPLRLRHAVRWLAGVGIRRRLAGREAPGRSAGPPAASARPGRLDRR
jgi:glycosyltransferase involved in cell wall biosynthesis